jgi:5'-3' exoribonuclease 1
MVQASDIFPGPDADAKVKEIRVWLNEKGVKDFEAVPLTTQALDKVSSPVSIHYHKNSYIPKNVIKEIEKLANDFTANRSTTAIKKARVERIPRRAVLKPSHAASFLHDQVFRLGDRVTMVQDSGGVPLCAKGIVVGLVEGMIDVVWDIAFIGGTKLGGRLVRISYPQGCKLHS